MDFPEQDELVIAVIKKIMPYGAFCVLPEYNNQEAFLHVSEIAPRWIKNIHEFVSEGQRHVAKIHRIDREKNQVDISLKRVSEEEKKAKLELMRTEKRADKLLALAIKNSKVKLTGEQVGDILTKEFGDVWSAFTEAQERKEEALKNVDLPATLKSEIVAIAEKNIKTPTVEISGLVSMTCWGVEGVEDVKKVLSEGENDVGVHYLGAPRYRLTLTAANYKDGEKKMAKVVDKMKSAAQKKGCDFSFELQKS
jgi:translation initiation factor 2 subunit 1